MSDFYCMKFKETLVSCSRQFHPSLSLHFGSIKFELNLNRGLGGLLGHLTLIYWGKSEGRDLPLVLAWAGSMSEVSLSLPRACQVMEQ